MNIFKIDHEYIFYIYKILLKILLSICVSYDTRYKKNKNNKKLIHDTIHILTTINVYTFLIFILFFLNPIAKYMDWIPTDKN